MGARRSDREFIEALKRFDLLDSAAKRLLLSGSLSFSLASANRFERFYRRVAQLVERCLDTAEVWGSSPHAPTIISKDRNPHVQREPEDRMDRIRVVRGTSLFLSPILSIV